MQYRLAVSAIWPLYERTMSAVSAIGVLCKRNMSALWAQFEHAVSVIWMHFERSMRTLSAQYERAVNTILARCERNISVLWAQYEHAPSTQRYMYAVLACLRALSTATMQCYLLSDRPTPISPSQAPTEISCTLQIDHCIFLCIQYCIYCRANLYTV